MVTRNVTATTAAREFSALLDEIDRTGDSLLVLRHGRPTALMVPVGHLLSGRLEATSRPADTQKETPLMNEPPEIENLLRPSPDREPLLRELLRRLRSMGLTLRAPGGEFRRDYINAYAPGIRGRVLSINASTGRTEFQTGSWASVGEIGPRFDRLDAGDKAAHPLETKTDGEVILRAAEVELARKRRD